MLTVNFVKDVDSIKKIVWIYLISLFLVSLFALFQFITGQEIIDLTGRGELNTWGGAVRVLGMSKNPNAFAIYLIVGITMTTNLFFSTYKILNKFLALIFIGIYSTAIMLTLSRGAWVAVLASFLLLLAFYRRAKISIFFIVITTGIILSLLWESIYYRFMVTVMNPLFDISIADRVFLAQSAVPMFLDHPVFGVGFGNFASELLNYSYRGVNIVGAHNIFIGIGTELGLLGLIPFIIIIVRVIKSSLHGISHARDVQLKNVLIGLLGSFVGIIVMGLTHESYINVLLWFIMGLIIAADNIVKRETFYKA